ncbi:hypothetical protein BU23DRAFT_467815 [Bimuria novae-zelandiae CBS 107.79]|uniref:DUF7730 domain-containing protein n=1 Tax=Bimuria novae-zelandiae CBS 107.79 TaxID=1447943 RepID=A0A6A5V843_9PLEO|nr:hypothetical protein BU23DRAFT_467815 [Bimuria novae-zelandiae CBS 107.79]
MKKLGTLLPSMRWVPHDIEPPTSSTPKKEKDKPKRLILGRKSTGEPYHGTLKRRKSTLSLTSVADEKLDARTHAQEQSRFFAMLPIEIRKIVYEFVVGRETVHLLFAKKRFGHFTCPAAEDGECECKVLVGGAHCQRLSGACVKMLVTCRRMYTEAAPHLYSPHIFYLLHVTHLLFLPTHVPQPRLNTIRTLRLKWTIRALPYFTRSTKRNARPAYPEDTANWEKGWTILSRMSRLQDLRVTIVDPSPEGIWQVHWLDVEGLLMESVKMVCTPRRTEVVLPYAGCRVDWDMGGSNVRLLKPAVEEEAGED